MTVIHLRTRQIMAESPPAGSRMNRDGAVDIGADQELRRGWADEKLEDALRRYRTEYGSNALAKLLECRLDAERRLICRELERTKP